jgi:beta-mannanase
MDTYKAYYPGSDYMDYIGIDAYPKQTDGLDNIFLGVAQEMHDEWCSESGPHFAMGETGLAYGGNADQKMAWLQSMVNAKEQMPYLHSVTWCKSLS